MASRVQTGNIADVIGELFQDVGAGLPEIALTLHNIKRQSEQDQFQREDRLAARKSEAARIAETKRGRLVSEDLRREQINIDRLNFLQRTGQDVTGFGGLFDKPEKLSPEQIFGRQLQGDPELLKRFTEARISAAELKGQRPATKGPSLSARLSAGKAGKQAELDRLGNLIMERFAENDPEGFSRLITEGKFKPTTDPIVLKALSRQFPATRREEVTGLKSLFQDSTDVSVADPQVDSLLNVLSQAFSRPALEFNTPLTAEEKAELKRRKALKTQQGNR